MANTLVGLLGVLLLATTGCAATVGSEKTIPSDSAQTCAGYCRDIGLELDCVVIMASNVGCVCRAAPPLVPGAPGAAAGGTAGGAMAAIIAAEQAQQAQAVKPK